MADLFKIQDWDAVYENNRSRELKAPLWCAVPNRFDGEFISELIDRGGDSAYAGWVGLVLIASRCKPRGVLIRSNGAPHDPKSLARITGLTAEGFRQALSIGVELGKIAVDTTSETRPARASHDQSEESAKQGVTRIPQEGAAKSHKPAQKGRKERKKESAADEPPRCEVWDAICELFSLNPVTRGDKSRVGKLRRDFKARLGDENPREGIRRRMQAHRRKWPNIDPITPESVDKHWDQLVAAPTGKRERDEAAERKAEERKQAEAQARAEAAAMSPEERKAMLDDLKKNTRRTA